MKLLLSIIVFYSFFGFSQETLSLQQSVDLVLAKEGNFIEQNAAISTATIQRKFHPWSILPTISATTNLSTSFGRRVDPFTNTFTTSQVNSQSMGLTASMPLFRGFNYFYQKEIFDNTLLQTDISFDLKRNELILATIDDFSAICRLQIQLALTELRIEHYKKVQTTQKKLIQGGKISSIDTLKSYNSILNEQLKLASIQSDFSLKTVRFNSTMNVPLVSLYSYNVESIADLETKPILTDEFQLKLAETNVQIAENELKSARTQNLPSISLSGNIGTGFSTNNKDYSLANNPTKPYRDQVNQNLYEGVGIYLTIPILNRGTWFKESQLNAVQLKQFEQSKELYQQNLELSKMENEFQYLAKAQEIIVLNDLVTNLEVIYTKTNHLYEEGRITYVELEMSYLDWEVKKLELELTKLEHIKSKLFLE